MAKKRDSLCFDIENLTEEQKIECAKEFKKTQDDFNKKLSKSDQTEKSEE